MPVELKDLSKDALRDLGSVRELGGHNDMTKDELVDGLHGPVDDDLAEWLGLTRQEIYTAAKDAGIDGAKDMDKRDLILKLSGQS